MRKQHISINHFKILEIVLLSWVTPRWEIASVFFFRLSLMKAIFQLCPLSQPSYLNSYKNSLRKIGFLFFRYTFQNILINRTTGCKYFQYLPKSSIFSPIIIHRMHLLKWFKWWHFGFCINNVLWGPLAKVTTHWGFIVPSGGRKQKLQFFSVISNSSCFSYHWSPGMRTTLQTRGFATHLSGCRQG